MVVSPEPMANGGNTQPGPPRRRWWQLGASVGQTVLFMLGLTLLAIPGLVNGWAKLNIWLQIAFTLVYIGMLSSGIATILTLCRHPDMQHATTQRPPLDRSTRRRYAVITLVGTGLAVLVLFAAMITQAPFAWAALAVIGLLTFFCLVQLDRPLIRDISDPVDPHTP